jgi:hypothetical protein
LGFPEPQGSTLFKDILQNANKGLKWGVYNRLVAELGWRSAMHG